MKNSRRRRIMLTVLECCESVEILKHTVRSIELQPHGACFDLGDIRYVHTSYGLVPLIRNPHCSTTGGRIDVDISRV